MIQQLVLRNFQGHRKLVLEFGKRVTSIVGPTDAGKSSVIRALTWVMCNQPDGDEFIHWDAKRAKVTLLVDDCFIERERGQGENLFTLEAPSGKEPKEFRAFGRDVPPEIQDLLRTNHLNFQLQHEGAFWFSESRGDVSRQLNTIVNLGIIDDALSGIGVQVKQARMKAQIAEGRLVEHKAAIAKARFAEEIDAALQEVESASKVKDSTAEQAARLRELLEQARGYRCTVKQGAAWALAGQEVVDLGQAALKEAARALVLTERLTEATRQKKAAAQRIPSLSALENLHAFWVRDNDKAKRLAFLIQQMRIHWTSRKNARAELATAKVTLNEKTQGRCPVCGGELHED
jgi:DNA repair exonuclease SbcCD ATPase subunit